MLPQDTEDKMQLLQLPVSYSVPTEFRALSYPNENASLREDVVIMDTGSDGDGRGDESKNTMIKAANFGVISSLTRGIITETSERPPDSMPFKIIPQNENVPVAETGRVGGQLKTVVKTTTKAQNLAPRVETRYFCHSCWCYVEQSQRRHDQMVHKPPRQATYKRIRTSIASAPALTLDCNICGKKFASKAGLSSHKRVHGTPEDKLDCFCYECNITVKRENYIDHLIMDDEARQSDRASRANSNSDSDSGSHANGVILSSINANGEMEEWKRRRFIYLNPNDPARNGPDAMLLCNKCPFTVFSTSRKFQEHNMAKHRKSGE